jgi:hypothetical protein
VKLSVFQNRHRISNRTKIILDEVLGDIVEAEFHFDRYNPLLSQSNIRKPLIQVPEF